MAAVLASSTIRTVRHESEHGRWELAHGRPGPALRGLVLGYQGYVEDRTSFTNRLETPHPNIVLIVNLGPAIRISGPGHPANGIELGSFVAGLHDRQVFVAATGPMRCLQVDLTPLGAARLMRQPMHELVNRTVALDDLMGADAGRLEARLDAAPSWAARFALLDAALEGRLAELPDIPRELRWAWSRMVATGGLTPVARLADDVGWSRKHLNARFRDQIGLPAKAFGRVIRFDRAVQAMLKADVPRLAEIALACGYYDQAHFNREFRALSGQTPGAFLARVMPDAGVNGD